MQDAIERLRVRAEYTHSLGPEHMHNIGNPYFSRPLLLSVKRYKWAITTIISDKEKVRDITLVFSNKSCKSKAIEGVLQGIYYGISLDESESKRLDAENEYESKFSYEIHKLSVSLFIRGKKTTKFKDKLIRVKDEFCLLKHRIKRKRRNNS